MESKITPRGALRNLINAYLGKDGCKQFVDEHYGEITNVLVKTIDKAEFDKTDTNEGVIQWIKDDITEETIGLEEALREIGMTVWHNDPGFDDHIRYIIDTKKKIDVLKELLEELEND